MNALNNLNNNISQLNATTDSILNYVSTLQAQTGVPEVDVQASADAVNAINAKLSAILPK